MSAVFQIAAEEWHYWRHSRLAWVGSVVFLSLALAVAALTGARAVEGSHLRREQQTDADERFASQPARHPHRMIHYGHYAFRTPAPLAVVDPGLDTITGSSIFLEGHRQNSATFAQAGATANAGGIGTVTTALMYQFLVPLFLIALGHGVVVREREAGTLAPLLAQGVSPASLVLGKGLALLGLVGASAVPLVVASAVCLAFGGAWQAAMSLSMLYAFYLLLWAGAALIASTVVRERAAVLALLFAAWLASALVVPRVGVALAQARVPVAGQLESQLQMQAEVDEAGDAHNPADPAFAKLRDKLLTKHGATRVEELPVNLRGVVAEASEAALAQVLDRHAEQRMALESQQARAVEALGWLSPTLALGFASRAVAGTDLSTHHRFLRETEALRLEFVQRLNRLHATALTYADDANRSRDAAAERRTRVASENWSLLRAFRFELAPPGERTAAALPSLLALAVWALALMAAGVLATRRLSP